jgi:hypothetical protein
MTFVCPSAPRQTAGQSVNQQKDYSIILYAAKSGTSPNVWNL